MGFDLRQQLEWKSVREDAAARATIVEWTEQEPTASMRYAVPFRGMAWMWELCIFFAPHSMPDASRCDDITWFSAPNEASFQAGHAAWLARIRPGGLDRVLVLLRDDLFDVTWDEYAQRFAPLATHCLAVTSNLRWAALGYHDEFIVCFRPKWEVISAIRRVKNIGGADDRERIVLHCHDAATWECGRLMLNLDGEPLGKLASVAAMMTGVKVEESSISWGVE